MRREVGENVGRYAKDQNRFLLESWYPTDMIPGSERVYTCAYFLKDFGQQCRGMRGWLEVFYIKKTW
jgi:hypothetical protein